MPQRRLLLIIVWAIGSLVGWRAFIFYAGSAVDHVAMYGRIAIPAIPTWVFPAIGFGGLVIVPAVVAVLGMRGKLPGTAKHDPRNGPRGFPIEQRSERPAA